MLDVQMLTGINGCHKTPAAETHPFAQPSGALFSDCRRFRYLLWRRWDASLPLLGWLALNPSAADASDEDQSSRKFRGFAERLGFGGYITANLYAWIDTYPEDLRAAGYLVGDENDAHTETMVRTCDAVICAWGSNARGLARPAEAVSIIRRAGRTPLALKVNRDGTPAHPLMLPYSCKLQPFGGQA